MYVSHPLCIRRQLLVLPTSFPPLPSSRGRSSPRSAADRRRTAPPVRALFAATYVLPCFLDVAPHWWSISSACSLAVLEFRPALAVLEYRAVLCRVGGSLRCAVCASRSVFSSRRIDWKVAVVGDGAYGEFLRSWVVLSIARLFVPRRGGGGFGGWGVVGWGGSPPILFVLVIGSCFLLLSWWW
jgi:hypothetical protein